MGASGEQKAEGPTKLSESETDQREALERLLQETGNEIRRRQAESHNWVLHLGPRKFTRTIWPPNFFWAFTLFHTAVGLTGGWLVLQGKDRAADLGIAMVVGALFGLGAFMAQVWVLSMDRHARFMEVVEAHSERPSLDALLTTQKELRRRLEQYGETRRAQPSSSS